MRARATGNGSGGPADARMQAQGATPRGQGSHGVSQVGVARGQGSHGVGVAGLVTPQQQRLAQYGQQQMGDRGGQSRTPHQFGLTPFQREQRK